MELPASCGSARETEREGEVEKGRDGKVVVVVVVMMVMVVSEHPV